MRRNVILCGNTHTCSCNNCVCKKKKQPFFSLNKDDVSKPRGYIYKEIALGTSAKSGRDPSVKDRKGGRVCCERQVSRNAPVWRGGSRRHNNPLVLAFPSRAPLLPPTTVVTVTDDLLRGATSAHGNTLR